MNKFKCLLVFIIVIVLLAISIVILKNKNIEGENVEIRELSYYVDNEKIYGKVYIPLDGKKKHKTIIMAPGFTADSDMYVSTAKYLAEKGYLCYAFDFRGGSFRGRSSKKFEDMSVITEKIDLEIVINNLIKEDYVDTRNVYFLGESMGALVGAITLGNYNDIIKASIFYYPAFNMKEMAEDSLKNGSSGNYYVLDVKVGDKFIEDLISLNPYELVKNYYNNIYVIHGSGDNIVPLLYSQRLEEENENIILDVIENEAHGFSEQGEKKARDLVFKFLEKYN